jgi:hypothetical protein
VTHHYLGLQDASVLATRDLLLTGRAVADLIESEAMGAVVGPAGLGKTFAIEHALAGREEQAITLTFEASPTMRLVADRLLVALTGAPGSGTRFDGGDGCWEVLAREPMLRSRIYRRVASGRLRSWAAFTQTASLICRGLGAERIDKAVARNASSQLGTAR